MVIDIDILLAWGGTYKKYAAEEIIFQESGICSFYYQLVSGSIRWVNVDEEGKEILQVMIWPGDCFGEIPLFDGGVYAATSFANENVVVIRLTKPIFLKLLKQNPEIHFNITKNFAERLRFKFMLLGVLSNHHPEQSIKHLFSYFKKNQKNICSNCNKVVLTRQQIADMIGLRVETVIRAIRTMHNNGELLIDKGKVYC